MKMIQIPQLHQDEGSFDCGPVCVLMILRYFNLEKEIEELKANMKYYDRGTSAYDNGLTLLSAGLKVTAITAHPYLFSPDVSCQSKEDVLACIDARLPTLEKFKDGLEIMRKYLTAGGDLRVEIPALKHIRGAIDSGSPVIALLYGRALGSMQGGFHFVVVNGYDEDKVFVTNPARQARTGWFPVVDFFYGVHTSTTADIDNGTLLVVSR